MLTERSVTHADNNDPYHSSEYDVVVIGGGPAGSTVSTILAQHGHRWACSSASGSRAFTSANR